MAQTPVTFARFVRQSPIAMRYLRFLGPLDWDRFPERDLSADHPMEPVPYAALAAACLIKIDQRLSTMSALRPYPVKTSSHSI